MFKLEKYQEFRTEASTLRDNITIVLSKMDATMADDSLSEPLRAQRMQSLLDTYIV